jgi:RNA polymerase sigma-70 factor (ECF subfamily)
MTKQTPLDELHLMTRIVARDQKALAELYDLFSPMVFGLALRVLNNAALAEEVLQDTFLKVWNQASDWDAERGKLVSWLLTIARYTAIDRLRQELRRNPDNLLNVDEIFHLADEGVGFRHEQWANEHVLRTLIVQLPPDQLQAIELAFFRGMSHNEIAEHLRQPLGTVKSRIRQGLQTLKGLWLQSVE